MLARAIDHTIDLLGVAAFAFVILACAYVAEGFVR